MSAVRNEPLADSPEYQAFARFARLTALKRELNERLRELEPKLRALEPILLGYLGQNGYQMVQVEGFTMSPRREPWVYPLSGISRQTVCEALKISGLGRFVKEGFSTRSITAYVRELEAHHELVAGNDPKTLKELLPPALADVLEVRPSFRLQVLDRRTNKTQRSESNATTTEEEEQGDFNDDLDE